MSEHWTKRADGSIALLPLTGWSSGVAAGAAVMLRIEMAPDAAALRDGRRSAAQTVMTPPQARDLAEALLRQAARAEGSPPAGSA